MHISHSIFDLLLYLLTYAFLGWAVEVGCYAVARRKFFNRGFATLPFIPSYGITFVLLILVLPTLGNNAVLQFIATTVIVAMVENLSRQIVSRVSPKLHWEPEHERLFHGSGKGALYSIAIAAVYYLTYLIIHPVLMTALMLIPRLIRRIVVIVLLALLAADYATVLYAVRTGDTRSYEGRQKHNRQGAAAAWLSNAIWGRLQRDYPGIREMDDKEIADLKFAQGVCWNKLIWVFLVTAVLGDIIETLYCGFVGGNWMNRSSVLYGPFSFVWGFGAVILTVTLRGLAGKSDRYVFLSGFIIGGVYEYMCSVFTELVFGTVFWDYSSMPLNIGGRTNVLFCFFWGLLAVVWIKVIYPPMDRLIEKLPALAGQVLTWAIVFVMVCNGVLTAAAMIRYDTRATRPEPANAIEAFLDAQYGDEMMEAHWTNMKSTTRS